MTLLSKFACVVGAVLLLLGFVRAQDAGVIRRIEVRGNVNISREAILTAMSSKEGGPFSSAQLPEDERAIVDLGFFADAQILSRQVAPGEWDLVVEVKENPVVREIRITGNTVVPTEEILAVVTQPIGEVLNFRTTLPTAEAISKLYERKGYFALADFQPLPESPETLNIVIVERAVNQIVITGLVRTRESVVRKLLRTRPGEAFSEEKWATDRRRLESTQWFETIEARSRDAGEIGKFDLLLDVKEARTGTLGVGLALDPRSRLAGSVRYLDSNFQGTGQTVGLELQQDTAGAGLSVGLDYLNPFLDDRDSSLSARLYSQVISYFGGAGFGSVTTPLDGQQFDERRTGAAVAWTRGIGRNLSSQIGFNVEVVRTLKFRGGEDSNFIQQDGTIGKLQLGLIRDTRDVPLDPAEGDYVRLALEPGFADITRVGGNLGDLRDLLGQSSFLKASVEYRRFWSRRPPPERLADPRNVLALRVKYGAIAGDVPFFEQFFAGGADTLRGYSDQRFWGKQSLLATVEYRVPIQRSFSVIGFVDYGGAWGGYGSIRDFTQSSSLNLKLGYGAGIGFRTPLGLIRIDFALNQEGRNRTHVSIGGGF